MRPLENLEVDRVSLGQRSPEVRRTNAWRNPRSDPVASSRGVFDVELPGCTRRGIGCVRGFQIFGGG